MPDQCYRCYKKIENCMIKAYGQRWCNSCWTKETECRHCKMDKTAPAMHAALAAEQLPSIKKPAGDLDVLSTLKAVTLQHFNEWDKAARACDRYFRAHSWPHEDAANH